jgi:uncharacterized protein YkwD
VRTLLPRIFGNGPAPQAEPDQARQLFKLMAAHPQQGRKGITWDARLSALAAEKCATMAAEGWTGHVSPSGIGANWIVRQAGYALPDYYQQGKDGNNIESLAYGGNGTAEQTWEYLLKSPLHRQHVLGTHEFFATQTVVGVGYAEGGAYNHYWAVWSVKGQ